MGIVPDAGMLSTLLPGNWSVAASNFPLWLAGDRLTPSLTYAVRSADPLVLDEYVSYRTPSGAEKRILGRDKWAGDHFLWRGRGLFGLFSSRWSVVGVSDDGSVAVIRFTKSMATPAGIDIVVRDGAEQPELRATIAGASVDFGLTAEDFASLTWLDERPDPRH
jgi:hypothetical protein